MSSEVQDSTSISEANALRIKLGLPLLAKQSESEAYDAAKQKKFEAERKVIEEENSATQQVNALRDEIARRKQQRELNKLTNAASMGEQLQFATAGSAAAWIERSKKMVGEEKKRAAERQKAEEAAKQEADITAANAYSSSSLSGLRIAHNYDEFDTESEHILTLADSKIIGANGIANEEEDELVNIHLSERERNKLNEDRRKGRGKSGNRYDAYGEDETTLLAKYDDEEEKNKKDGMRLGSLGEYAKAREEERKHKEREDKLKERRERGDLASEDHKLTYDLSTSTHQPISDFKEIKFKKKKSTMSNGDTSKRSNLRVKDPNNDWIKDLEAEAVSSNDYSQDHGSRNRGTGLSEREKKVAEEKEEKKNQGYLRAIERGNEDINRRKENDRIEKVNSQMMAPPPPLPPPIIPLLPFPIDFLDEEERELEQALTRARRLAQSRQPTIKKENSSIIKSEPGETSDLTNDSIPQIALRIKEEVKRENENKMHVINSSDEIVFTSTTEFCRGLQFDDKEDESRRKIDRENARIDEEYKLKKENDEKKLKAGRRRREENGWSREEGGMEVDNLEDNLKEEEIMNGNEEAEEDDVDEEGEEVDGDHLIEDEPLASGGLAAALALAKRRQYLKGSGISNTSNPNSFSRPLSMEERVNFTRYDALGREMSIKEKFREQSHDFHGHHAGINKTDKRKRRIEKEQAALQKARQEDKKLGELQEVQRRMGQVYVILDKKIGEEEMAAVKEIRAAKQVTEGTVSIPGGERSSGGWTNSGSRVKKVNKFIKIFKKIRN